MAAGSRDLCIMACTFCRYPDFWEYLQAIDPQHEPWTEGSAKEFILAICEINSRSDLDRNEQAELRFHELVRKPFVAWRQSKQGDRREHNVPRQR
jgi:hypothetical protein